jgi:hypothetical protein
VREEDSANLFAASSARMPRATYLSSVSSAVALEEAKALAKEDQVARRDAYPLFIRVDSRDSRANPFCCWFALASA